MLIYKWTDKKGIQRSECLGPCQGSQRLQLRPWFGRQRPCVVELRRPARKLALFTDVTLQSFLYILYNKCRYHLYRFKTNRILIRIESFKSRPIVSSALTYALFIEDSRHI